MSANNQPGVPMLLPEWLERAQIKYINPLMAPIARFLPSFATVTHYGRTSGTKYETTVNAFRKGNVVSIALIHGKTNWTKNVIAAAWSRHHAVRRQADPCGQPPHRGAGPGRSRPDTRHASGEQARRRLRGRHRTVSRYSRRHTLVRELHVQTDVEHPCGVGQCPNRKVVDTCLGVRSGGFQG